MEPLMQLGSRARQMREDLGLSQDQVAGKIANRFGWNVTQGQIGHIESGRSVGSVQVLYGLAAVLETSVDYLMGNTDNPLPASDLEEQRMASELARIYDRLSPSRRMELRSLAETMLQLDQKAPVIGYDELMAALLTQAEKLGGEQGLNELLDLLEAQMAALDATPLRRMRLGSAPNYPLERGHD